MIYSGKMIIIKERFLRALIGFLYAKSVSTSTCFSKNLCREQLPPSSSSKYGHFSTMRILETRLNFNAFETSVENSEQSCLVKCMLNISCFSVNLIKNVTANTTDMECQLLSQQAYSYKEKLVKQNNSTHLTVKNSGCDKNMCLNNATCIPNYNNDSHTCTCLENFRGVSCEQEVKVALLRYNKSSTTGYTVDDFMQDNNFKQKIESSKCMFQLADSNTIRTNQLGHAFTFFTPPQSGVYKFLMNCSGFCRLYVSTPGKQDRKILADTKSGFIGLEVYINKSSTRLIEVIISVGDSLSSGSFEIGVEFPDGSISQPIETMAPNYHELLVSYIGEFGLAQLFLVAAVGLPKVVIAWTMIIIGFSTVEPDWWIVKTLYNITTNLSDSTYLPKQCAPLNNEEKIYFSHRNTIVTEWNLVCDKKWIPMLAATLLMLGLMGGSIFMGQMADIIGRRRGLLVALLLHQLFALLLGASINWQMFLVCSFFIGAAVGSYLVLCNILPMEFVGAKYRTITFLIPFWGLGIILFGGLMMVLPYWRHMFYTVSVLGSPMLLFLWVFVPESVRWLLTQGRYKEGKRILKTMARRNKLGDPNFSLLKDTSDEQIETSKKIFSYISLFKHRQSRNKAFIFFMTWCMSSFIYYGLTLGVGCLHGNPGINMILMGIGDSMQSVIVWSLSKCFARKNTTILLMFGGAVSSLGITVAYFTSTKNQFEKILRFLAILSRTLVTAGWSSNTLYTAESFPTVVRTLGYSVASIGARIGGILAPQIKLLDDLSPHIPYTINGVLAFLCGLLCLPLKDTFHQPMTDHLKLEEIIKEEKSVKEVNRLLQSAREEEDLNDNKEEEDG